MLPSVQAAFHLCYHLSDGHFIRYTVACLSSVSLGPGTVEKDAVYCPRRSYFLLGFAGAEAAACDSEQTLTEVHEQ